MLFQRTKVAKLSDDAVDKEISKLRARGMISTDLALRDPYVLDFLNLPSGYSEKDLESAVLVEFANFIQEFGSDFCFMGRQKRITMKKKDYYIDLLFYHRSLERLIAIELKLGAFKPSHKGQMELYLKWLNKYERKENEKEPLGIILCSEKDDEEIELLELQSSGIHVAEYFVELPPKKVFEEKLHKAITLAKEKLASQQQLEKTSGDC